MHKQFALFLTIFVAFAAPAAPADDALRTELENAHDALVRNDRPTFDVHMARIRANPRAADHAAARVLTDAAVVWDALFVSPYFEESSDAYKRASAHPGYADAVRRGVLTDAQQRRFYPASDSLRFLTRLAGQRLGRTGDARALPRVARARRSKT